MAEHTAEVAAAGRTKPTYHRIHVAEVKAHPVIDAFVRRADEHVGRIGYTEHGYRHVGLVSHITHNILSRLEYPSREAELAEIAGYTHDIGNAINRVNHGNTAAVLTTQILLEMGMDPDEVTVVAGAIGNHEEEYGSAVNNVSAALILADKSDVHRSRVRNKEIATFDIHDRVNYAAVHSFLDVDPVERHITLQLTIETEICSVMEYFEIFLSRMMMCRRAAEVLACRFGLEINGATLL